MDTNTEENEHVELTFLERLDMFINMFYGSRVKFAEAIEFKPSTIASYFGGKKSKPSFEFFEKLNARHPDLDLRWLISGHASPGSKNYAMLPGMGQKSTSSDLEKSIDNLAKVISQSTDAMVKSVTLRRKNDS